MHHLARAILILPLLAASAAAGGDRLGADAPWSPRPPGSSSAGRGAQASRQLEAFAAQRRLESRARLTRTQRDSQRRAEAARLRQGGSRADLAAYARRIAREDDLDRLRLDGELARLRVAAPADALGAWWDALGPATRRVFLRGGLDWQPAAQEREREQHLQALERDIDARDARAASGIFAPAELP
jgi:hypothetical protein